jgi:hypothetical protein
MRQLSRKFSRQLWRNAKVSSTCTQPTEVCSIKSPRGKHGTQRSSAMKVCNGGQASRISALAVFFCLCAPLYMRYVRVGV